MARKKRTLEQRQASVKQAWDRIEDAEPDISTERLLMMVADDTDEDYGDVAALYQGENPADLITEKTMPQFFWDLAQGSAAWHAKRRGIPTASNFDQVMTPKTMKPSESRKKYGARLIAERVLNWQADSLEMVKHIAEGKEHEPLAVAKMELVYDIESEPVGFVSTNDGRFGASPDRVAGLNPTRDRVSIVTEVKSPTIPIQMERLIFGDNDAYRCQRQGQLWVAEADKAIFFSYNPRTPDFMIEDGRDEKFLAALADCLERFSDELDEWEAKVRAAGVFQAYAELLPPAEVEHAENLQGDRLMSDAELDALINTDHMKWGG